MSLLRDSAADGERLVRYLLGFLPEDEAERLDEQSVVNDDVACRLLSAENDLVDAYVRGTLDPGLRRRFESFYLASPRRRQRVRFARRFLAVVDRMPARASTATATFATRLRAGATSWMFRQRKFTWRPMAAAAVLMLALGALVAQNVNLRTGLNQALHDSAAQDHRAQTLSSQLDAARESNIELARALEGARARSSDSRRDPAVSPAPAAILLMPQTRSLGPLPTLAVAPVGSVPFELRLESGDFTRYRAILKDQDTGLIVWESGVLIPRSVAAVTVPVFVPADVLKPPHRYAFELAGVGGAGRDEAVGSYAFQIDAR
jgi:hypothetical protein